MGGDLRADAVFLGEVAGEVLALSENVLPFREPMYSTPVKVGASLTFLLSMTLQGLVLHLLCGGLVLIADLRLRSLGDRTLIHAELNLSCWIALVFPGVIKVGGERMLTEIIIVV